MNWHQSIDVSQIEGREKKEKKYDFIKASFMKWVNDDAILPTS